MARPQAKRKVLKAFFETEKDATPEEVADKAGVSSKTAKKWIKELLDQGDIVETREIGRTSLYKLAPPAQRRARTSSRAKSTKRDKHETTI